MSATQEVRFSTWRNILIADWYRDTTEDGVKLMVAQIGALHQRTGRSIGLLHIVGAKSDAPSSAARKAMAQAFKDNEDAIAINATVIDGAGFRAAAVRAVASGIAMLARMKFPHEVHPNLEAGVDRLLSFLKFGPGTRMQLLSAVSDLRAKEAA